MGEVETAHSSFDRSQCCGSGIQSDIHPLKASITTEPVVTYITGAYQLRVQISKLTVEQYDVPCKSLIIYSIGPLPTIKKPITFEKK